MSSVSLPDSLNWGAVTTKGTRKEVNEDSHDFFTLAWGKEGKTVVAMVVADGISSTKGGGHASQVAVETIKSVLMEPSDSYETTSDRMAQAITLANQEVLFQARQNPNWSRMGTTVVLALVVDKRLYVMGVGDSRAYLIRDQQVYRLTTDHTWAQYALDAGNLPVAAINRHPHRSRLVRYLGNPNGFHIDRGIISPESKEKEEYILVQAGDAVLLCSDGLYKLVSENEFNQTISHHLGESSKAVSALLALARQKGERDDITALMLKVSEEHPASESLSADAPRSVLSPASPPALPPGASAEAPPASPPLPHPEPLLAKQGPVQTLRFALATVVALVALTLLIFQLNYRQEGKIDAATGATERSPTASARALLEVQPTPTSTVAPTTTQQPAQGSIQGNGTIPLPPTLPPPTLASPTRILPTVALPTPVAGGS